MEIIKDLLGVLVFCILSIIFVWLLAEFLAHVSRYRAYIRAYPAAKVMRGKVWKITK